MTARTVRRACASLSPERQREYAEEHRVTRLYDWMRGEAVRQVWEILGVATDPDDWWFHQAGGSSAIDWWHLEIYIDEIKVWLNAGYRLCAEPSGIGKTDSRIRSAADFQKSVEAREWHIRGRDEWKVEAFKRECQYRPLGDGQDPLPRDGAYRCRCSGGPYADRKFRSPTAPLTIGFPLEGQLIAGDSYTHEAIYEREDRQWGIWVYQFARYVSAKREPGR